MLLGTAMWYPFYDLQGADDATFEAKVEPIVRAIGDRGKVRTQGSAGFPHQAAVARAPATASEPSPEGAAAAPARAPVHAFATSSGNLSELAAILREQRDEAKAERLAMEAKMEQLRAEAKAERDEIQAHMEARLERQRAELMPRPAQQAVTEVQLATLQARFERPHATKLVSDEELYALEDLVADWAEVQASMMGQVVTEVMLYASAGNAFVPGMKVHKVLKISAVTPGDPSFARQVRRKFLHPPHPTSALSKWRAAVGGEFS